MFILYGYNWHHDGCLVQIADVMQQWEPNPSWSRHRNTPGCNVNSTKSSLLAEVSCLLLKVKLKYTSSLHGPIYVKHQIYFEDIVFLQTCTITLQEGIPLFMPKFQPPSRMVKCPQGCHCSYFPMWFVQVLTYFVSPLSHRCHVFRSELKRKFCGFIPMLYSRLCIQSYW